MNQTNKAIFFLSTGRCGTQWLHKTFKAVYTGVATVTHEPVRPDYQAKRYLRADNFADLLSSRRVSRHLRRITRTLQTKTYIETGWPSYPALPFLIDQLEGRVQLVHLVRHPVFTALSMATHKMYERPDWVKGFALTPFDAGVVQKEMATTWPAMTMYEKCLFWWTEVNLYALELQAQYPDLEFFFLRYEDLFGADVAALKALVAFMGLTYEPALETHKLKPVDMFQFKSTPVDWTLLFNYPRTVALAEQFGYQLDKTERPHLARRYFEERPVYHLLQSIRQVGHLAVESVRTKLS